jgi:pSer/pThr/pTyr-binding forkhead associated (FHA) protein
MEDRVLKIQFEVYEGETLQRTEVFEQKAIRIGKAGQAHLRISDPNVSRQHAIVEVLDSGEVRITDLESTNGTFLNGVKIDRAVLKSGDEIVIGQTRLVVRFEQLAQQERLSETFYKARAVEEEDLTEKAVLEIVVLWNDEVVTIQHVKPQEKVLAGDKPGCRVFLPSEYLGERLVEFAQYVNGKFRVFVNLEMAEGDAFVEGEIIPVKQLAAREKLVDRDYLVFDEKTKVRLKFGPFAVLVSLSRLPPPVHIRWFQKFDPSIHTYTALSLILHLLFLIMVTLIPEGQLRAVRDPYQKRSVAFRMLQMADMEKKAKEEERKKSEQQKQAKKFETQERVAGEHVRADVKKPDELVSKLSVEERRERDRQVALMAMTRVLSAQGDLVSQVLGAGGEPTLGGTGIRVIGSHGPGGGLVSGLDAFGGTIGGGTGGFRGSPGLFGGSSEFGPADLKGLKGLEKEEAGREIAGTKFSEKEGKAVAYQGAAEISGDLDKATVKRYIDSKMAQIKWCYQQALLKTPDLQGEMAIEWIITPSGKVMGVKVLNSAIQSKEMEQCIVSRIGTWTFPPSKSGLPGRVRYPFVFRVVK